MWPDARQDVSCGLSGVYGYPVEVEAFISNGMIGFEIVGLPSMAVKESRDRVRAAIAVSGLSLSLRQGDGQPGPCGCEKGRYDV